jgi:hypothetical protein
MWINFYPHTVLLGTPKYNLPKPFVRDATTGSYRHQRLDHNGANSRALYSRLQNQLHLCTQKDAALMCCREWSRGRSEAAAGERRFTLRLRIKDFPEC